MSHLKVDISLTAPTIDPTEGGLFYSEWADEWPSDAAPDAYECRTCRRIYPESAMRRPLTDAERANGIHGWKVGMKCKSCQSAELSALRPAALRKKLSNYGDIPADEINAKIASREAASSQRRKKAARRRWADAHFAKNKATFDEMNADKQRFRSRATYLAQKGAPLASAAYRDYSDLLANAVTLYRLRAKDGLAPYAPWYEGLYQSSMLYEWLMRVVNALEHASHDEAESKRMNGIFPVWWGERERMLAHKSRPKHEEGAAQQATEASPDFDHLVAAARSQWTKRNMGTKVPRKTKPPPAPVVVSIPGVDPKYTTFDPPKRRPRAAVPGLRMTARERLEAMREDAVPYEGRTGELLIPRKPRVLPAPIAPRTPEEMAADEDRIRAENEALFRAFNLPTPTTTEDTD